MFPQCAGRDRKEKKTVPAMNQKKTFRHRLRPARGYACKELPGTKLYDMVHEEIDPHEYSLLNWNGSVLTERLNKSKIKNLALERRVLHKRYLFRSLIKQLFNISSYFYILKMGNKYQRFKFLINHFIKGVLYNLTGRNYFM